MKKIVSILMIYAVAFMGFATTPQGVSLNAYSAVTVPQGFDTLPFGTELEAEELAQVEGEGRLAAGVAVGYAVTKAVDNIPTRGGKSTVGKDVNNAVQKGYKAAGKSLNERAKRTGRKCMSNPRRCAD